MKTIFISILIFANISIAQKSVKFNESKISPETDLKENSITSQLPFTNTNLTKLIKYRIENLEIKHRSFENTDKRSFDVLGNISNNVSFGGFYENFALLNFTPQLNIDPAEFLNIYANHYYNIFIPLSRAKDISSSVIINSFSLLILDGTSDLLFEDKNWIAQIAELALKNCIINVFLKPKLTENQFSNDKILHFDNFYYSLRIIF